MAFFNWPLNPFTSGIAGPLGAITGTTSASAPAASQFVFSGSNYGLAPDLNFPDISSPLLVDSVANGAPVYVESSNNLLPLIGLAAIGAAVYFGLKK